MLTASNACAVAIEINHMGLWKTCKCVSEKMNAWKHICLCVHAWECGRLVEGLNPPQKSHRSIQVDPQGFQSSDKSALVCFVPLWIGLRPSQIEHTALKWFTSLVWEKRGVGANKNIKKEKGRWEARKEEITIKTKSKCPPIDPSRSAFNEGRPTTVHCISVMWPTNHV